MFYEFEYEGKTEDRFILVLVENSANTVHEKLWHLSIHDWQNKMEIIFHTYCTLTQARWMNRHGGHLMFPREHKMWQTSHAQIEEYLEQQTRACLKRLDEYREKRRQEAQGKLDSEYESNFERETESVH